MVVLFSSFFSLFFLYACRLCHGVVITIFLCMRLGLCHGAVIIVCFVVVVCLFLCVFFCTRVGFVMVLVLSFSFVCA